MHSKSTAVPIQSLTAQEPPSIQERLLRLWLKMSPEQRQKFFAETRRAAEIFSVSQRTIQSWIERDCIHSLRIGKKHYVWLKSVNEYLLERSQEVTDEEHTDNAVAQAGLPLIQKKG